MHSPITDIVGKPHQRPNKQLRPDKIHGEAIERNSLTFGYLSVNVYRTELPIGIQDPELASAIRSRTEANTPQDVGEAELRTPIQGVLDDNSPDDARPRRRLRDPL